MAEVVSTFDGILEANVYGVEVPGSEGRACCVGLVLQEGGIDFSAFAAHCKEQLPSYAVPLFVRQITSMDITGTFKHQKVKLRNEGINPALCKDKLLTLSKDGKSYVPFGLDEYKELVAASPAAVSKL